MEGKMLKSVSPPRNLSKANSMKTEAFGLVDPWENIPLILDLFDRYVKSRIEDRKLSFTEIVELSTLREHLKLRKCQIIPNYCDDDECDEKEKKETFSSFFRLMYSQETFNLLQENISFRLILIDIAKVLYRCKSNNNFYRKVVKQLNR